MKFSSLLLCALVAGPALAQPATEAPVAGRGTEQARIAAERTRLEAGFKAEEAACYRRFQVNACLEEIRPRRAEVMAELRRQEISINEAERKAKAQLAAKRRKEIALGILFLIVAAGFAVLAVVLCHARLFGCSGGFLGLGAQPPAPAPCAIRRTRWCWSR